MAERQSFADRPPYLPGLAQPPRAPEPEPLMVLPPQSAPDPKRLLDLPHADMLRLCRALQNVSFGTNYRAKLIVASVAHVTDLADVNPVYGLSARKRNALLRIAYRYRRQLPPAIRSSVERTAR